MHNLFIQVLRQKKSHDYKYDETKSSYTNNIKNNSIDTIQILKYDIPIYECKHVQTIANSPEVGMLYSDSLNQCDFKIRCFVEKRGYKEAVHGIIEAIDLNGDWIDTFSMQDENGLYKGRWLLHNKYYDKIKKDTNFAYSGGCIIFSSKDFSEFNRVLKNEGIQSGDIIHANLREV